MAGLLLLQCPLGLPQLMLDGGQASLQRLLLFKPHNGREAVVRPTMGHNKAG